MSEVVNITTPCGGLRAEWQEERLVGLYFGDAEDVSDAVEVQGVIPDQAASLIDELNAYFSGDRRALAGFVPVPDGTAFQMNVWEATTQIPYGETVSYGHIAEATGVGIEGSRAVGIALNQNPLPLIVPCHRVIGANGDLTGFGGGLTWKRRLLDLEMPQFSLSL